MVVDLSQFHQVFFEESKEGLDLMEASLMGLNPDGVDSEIINAIFRAAHSIKGGAGTFGFTDVADFTHVLETLLDEIRSGQRAISQDDVDLYLQSVDCLREMLDAAQKNEAMNMEVIHSVQGRFEQMLASEPAAVHSGTDNKADATLTNEVDGATVEAISGDAPSPSRCWWVDFRPQPGILRTGNEPSRMFRDLGEQAELQVTAVADALPPFELLEPELCYLQWQLRVRGDIGRQQIDEVFEWVADEADITIRETAEFNTDAASLSPSQQNSEVAAAPTDGVYSDDSGVAQAAAKNSSNAAANVKANIEAAPKETSSIRVAIDKIDNLINMVGELVITQSMLGQIGTNFSNQQLPRLLEGLGQLEHNTRELQESVMRIRMLPISFAFSRFPRMVRDLGRRMGKTIDLVLMGEQTELDKTVMERIGDPLVHLVRNAVDHGVETPGIRRQAGKSETGTITLNAYHQSGNVVIEIIDDGKGLSRDKIIQKAVEKHLISEMEAQVLADVQVFDLIFQPGFSTVDQVSDVSGRGVGMDVVKRNIQDLNGTVDIKSETGVGTTITIRLPLTLAILDGQLVRVGSNTYIFPLVSIVESTQVSDGEVNVVAGGCEVYKLRHEYVPVIRLHEVFDVRPDNYELKESLLVVVESDGEKVGIVVDELAAQQQVVIKSLEQNYQRVEGVSGATILGDGKVSLILDVPGLVKLAGVRHLAKNGKLQLRGGSQRVA